MKPALDIKPVRLPARAVHSIERGKGLQVTAVSGVVWITQARDTRDIILTRGQTFILDRAGRAVVYALKDAAIIVSPAGHVTLVPAQAGPLAQTGALGHPREGEAPV